MTGLAIGAALGNPALGVALGMSEDDEEQEEQERETHQQPVVLPQCPNCESFNSFWCDVHNALTCGDCGFHGYSEEKKEFTFCDWLLEKKNHVDQ